MIKHLESLIETYSVFLLFKRCVMVNPFRLNSKSLSVRGLESLKCNVSN